MMVLSSKQLSLLKFMCGILVLSWLLYSDDYSEVRSTVAGTLSELSNYVYEKLCSTCNVFSGIFFSSFRTLNYYLFSVYKYSMAAASTAIESVNEYFYSFGSVFTGLFTFFSDSVSSSFLFLWDFVLNGWSLLFTFGNSTTEEMVWEESSPILEEDSIGNGVKADLSSLEQRILHLEKFLSQENGKRSEDEKKIAAALHDYQKLLLDHRAGWDNALRRCRWPCPTYRPPDSLSPAVLDQSLTEVHKLISDLGRQHNSEIETLRAQLKEALEARESSIHSSYSGNFDAALVRKIVDDAIKVYDADKTGRADFALESAGGRVVSIRCTKAYNNKGYYSSWGFPVSWTITSNPEDAIRPGMAPGECFAFQGSVGYLALELSYRVMVTGFTMEHIPKSLSPNGTIDSAPQHFSMWGLKHADDLYEQYLFGQYVYKDSDETVQYFPVTNPTNTPFKFVELKIVSNHGHPDYTCLYRIRVHGTVT